jgi:cytochrome c biogenesis protein ResB
VEFSATFRGSLLWLTLTLLALLAVLAVVGAFLGPQQASELFNNPPLAGVWTLLALVLLCAAVALLVRRRVGLAMLHAGAMLVILGGMWGSQGVHRLSARWAREVDPAATPTPREGYMLLHTGRPDRLLLQPLGESDVFVPVDELPLRVELVRAEIEYYPNDRPNTPPAVRDYLATLRVTQDGRTLAEKTIEVNDPLHAGGYQFTLSQLDVAGGTVLLQVISDRGLPMVYAGFALLVTGAFGHYWLGPTWRHWATRRDRR